MKRLFISLIMVAIVAIMSSPAEAHTVKKEPVKMEMSIDIAGASLTPLFEVVYSNVSFIPDGVYIAIRKANETKLLIQTGCGYDSAGVYYCCDASGHCYAAKDPNKKKSIRLKPIQKL